MLKQEVRSRHAPTVADVVQDLQGPSFTLQGSEVALRSNLVQRIVCHRASGEYGEKICCESGAYCVA